MTMSDVRSPNVPRRLLVIAGLTVTALLVLAGAGWVTLQLQSHDFHFGTVVPASSGVRVSAQDLAVDLEPATDGRVHVQALGRYRWHQPQVSVRPGPDGVEVDATCDSSGLGLCDLSVEVDLPAGNAVSVVNTNGRLSARALTGHVSLATTNGSIRAAGLAGDVTMQTKNGAIDADGLRSPTLAAISSNGSESLNFVTAPTTVTARDSNGNITVTVPGTASYDVQPATTNGDTTVSVPRASASGHAITATTTNGNVRVQAS